MFIFKKDSFIELHQEIPNLIDNKRYYPQDTVYYFFGIPVYKKRVRVLLYTDSVDSHILSDENTKLLFHGTKKPQNT